MEYCTMKNSVKLCNIPKKKQYTKKIELKWPRLIELHKTLFNSEPNNLHNALIDILVCFRCFYKMVYDVDPMTINNNFRESCQLYCDL
jgi:hypothetical protein